VSGLRVVLANEPAVYREVISSAIAVLRPDFEVFTAEPAYLDREFARRGPRLVVVCSRLTELVERDALAWVQLYPCGASHTLVALDGERPTKVAHMDLDTLLGMLDVADRVCQRKPRDTPGVRSARKDA
jgi:hypothetical protein